MTKTQQIDVLKTENEQLRKLMADNNAAHAAEIKLLNRKLFELNSARAKWEARARASNAASQNKSDYAARAAAAREEAMRSGRTVAV